MGHAYVDDNETIYYNDSYMKLNLSGNDSISLFASINDNPLDQLISGQSTVFINSIKVKATGYLDPDATDFNYTHAKFLTGIVPFDLFNIDNGPSEVDDYQQLKGWPLKGCVGFSNVLRPRDNAMLSSEWQGYNSNFSYTKTYKPRKALLLSRMQAVCFTVKNDFVTGSDFNVLLSIEIQMKRGD